MKHSFLKQSLFITLAIYLCMNSIKCQSNTTVLDINQNTQNFPSTAITVDNALPINPPKGPVEEKYTFWNSFLSGFSIIFVAEIGDRTFILIMIYAVTNNFLKTFLISNFVLLLWNYISIMIGYNIPFLMNKNIVEWVGIFTFTLFGILMIKDGYYMESKLVEEEFLEEEEILMKMKHNNAKVVSLDSQDQVISNKNSGYIINDNNLKEVLLDNNRNKNSKENNFIKTDIEKNGNKDDEEKNFFDSFWAFGFTLIMAELGDKSQIAAIVIGATQNFYGVLIGTSLAHSLCTIIAIVFGNIFSRYVTTRQITIIGGLIFLIFAAFFLIGKF